MCGSVSSVSTIEEWSWFAIEYTGRGLWNYESRRHWKRIHGYLTFVDLVLGLNGERVGRSM